ncbi:hypothetical protein M758_9G058900 [Ceratodon purpureus]|nr:hypothetical protein M758_9G058900 [Ceratodon purpureus]
MMVRCRTMSVSDQMRDSCWFGVQGREISHRPMHQSRRVTDVYSANMQLEDMKIASGQGLTKSCTITSSLTGRRSNSSSSCTSITFKLCAREELPLHTT